MRKRFIAVERLHEIVRQALEAGRGRFLHFQTGSLEGYQRGVFQLDRLHNCSQPYQFELHARYSATAGKRVQPIMIRGSGRCRKCESCKMTAQRFWQGRAIAEYKMWPRTVFGTFTLSPEQHYALDCRIMAGTWDEKKAKWLRVPKPDFPSRSPEEMFQLRAAEMGAEVTKYLKRLRAGDWKKGRQGPGYHYRPNCRYLLVAERHDSASTSDEMRGRPHFHVLIHETTMGQLILGNPIEALLNGQDGEWIRKKYKSRGVWKDGVFVKDDAFLRRKWDFGFTKFQWANNEKAAFYVCKYITKEQHCRVRASKFYGDGSNTSQQPQNAVITEMRKSVAVDDPHVKS